MSTSPLEHLKHIPGTQAPVLVDKPKDDDWIQDAHLKKNALTKQAKRAGFSDVQKYAKWVLDPKNKSRTTETTKRRARLAQTFAKMYGKGFVVRPGTKAPPPGAAARPVVFHPIPSVPRDMPTTPVGKGAVEHSQKPGFLLQTSDIDDYLKPRVPNFVGTFSKKFVPKLKKQMEKMKTAYAVINLDDNAGSHWVVMIHDNGKFFWVDPLGAAPPKIAMNHLDPYWSETIYQDATGAECGLYAIKIIQNWAQNDDKADCYKAEDP